MAPVRKSRFESPLPPPVLVPAGPFLLNVPLKLNCPIGLVAVDDVQLVANIRAAERDLMLAADQVYIVGKGEQVVIKMGSYASLVSVPLAGYDSQTWAGREHTY